MKKPSVIGLALDSEQVVFRSRQAFAGYIQSALGRVYSFLEILSKGSVHGFFAFLGNSATLGA
jgi:hypothetical protein